MLDAETSVRTLHSYAGILQGRLALARASGSGQDFRQVRDAELALVAMLCTRATDVIDIVLNRVGPEYASHAAAVADLACQREFELPRSPGAAQLRLVAADLDRRA